MYIKENILKNAKNTEKVSDILDKYFKPESAKNSELGLGELRRRGFEELKLLGETEVYKLLLNKKDDRDSL